jgi:hypothetical protein
LVRRVIAASSFVGSYKNPDENIGFDLHAVTDKGVARDFHVAADDGVLLNLHKSPDLRVVSNGASVQVDKGKYPHVAESRPNFTSGAIRQ